MIKPRSNAPFDLRFMTPFRIPPQPLNFIPHRSSLRLLISYLCPPSFVNFVHLVAKTPLSFIPSTAALPPWSLGIVVKSIDPPLSVSQREKEMPSILSAKSSTSSFISRSCEILGHWDAKSDSIVLRRMFPKRTQIILGGEP